MLRPVPPWKQRDLPPGLFSVLSSRKEWLPRWLVAHQLVRGAGARSGPGRPGTSAGARRPRSAPRGRAGWPAQASRGHCHVTRCRSGTSSSGAS